MSFGQGISPGSRISGNLVLLWLLAVLVLLASGCATMNMSNFESAIPYADSMGAGRISFSSGIDLAELILSDTDTTQNGGDTEEYFLFPHPGLQLMFKDDTSRWDLGLRFWTTLGCIGVSFEGKYLLAGLGRSYLAVMPGVTFVSGFAEDREPFYEDKCYFNGALGGQLQLLYTFKFSEDWSITLIGRGGGMEFYQDYKPDYEWEPQYYTYSRGLWNYGWRANLRFPLGKFHLIPEGGVEYLRLSHDKTVPQPIVGLAFEF